MICDKEDTETINNNKRTIKVPHSVDCLQGILSVIPLQLLAFHLAVLRGYDVSTILPVLSIYSPKDLQEIYYTEQNPIQFFELTSTFNLRGFSCLSQWGNSYGR